MTTKLEQAALDLLEGVEAAIKAGDWKVDGACDPDLAMYRLREALAEQAEYTQAHTSDKPLHHFALVLRDLDKTIEGWCEEPEFYLNGERLYAAPVRTKDMTDNEINKISNTIVNATPANMTVEDWKRSFARAVIAAYKEKNK